LSQIKITLKKSLIGRKQNQIDTVKALGLKKIGQSVTHQVNPAIQGMVEKVQHLVEVVEA
jgi:large subunit ribosomal protein L30